MAVRILKRLAVFVGLVVAIGLQAVPAAANDCRAGSDPELKVESISNFSIEIENYPDCLQESRVRVANDGIALLTLRGDRFSVYGAAEETDVTGNGLPDVIIRDWSGGAHCCFTFHVVELGRQPRLVATIDTRHSDQPTIQNLDGKPGLEIAYGDWTYADRWTAFSASPVPRIVFHLTPVGPRFSAEQMRRPIDEAKLAHTKSVFEALDADERTYHVYQAQAVYQPALDLVYAGHWTRAMTFFADIWPTEAGDMETARVDFICEIRRSPFWPDIATLNGLAVDKGTEVCSADN